MFLTLEGVQVEKNLSYDPGNYSQDGGFHKGLFEISTKINLHCVYFRSISCILHKCKTSH